MHTNKNNFPSFRIRKSFLLAQTPIDFELFPRSVQHRNRCIALLMRCLGSLCVWMYVCAVLSRQQAVVVAGRTLVSSEDNSTRCVTVSRQYGMANCDWRQRQSTAGSRYPFVLLLYVTSWCSNFVFGSSR